MLKKTGYFFRLSLAFVLILFLGGVTFVQAQPEFLVYTFKADASVKIGFPKGWTVQENQMGAVITEKAAADSAGIMFILGQLQPGVDTNAALTKTMIDFLRKQGYPDLKAIKQQPHAQAPDVLTIDATLTAGGAPFRAHMWCSANTQNKIGIFLVFYAPANRYAAFNPQHYLASCAAPLFGGQPVRTGQAAGQASPAGTVSSGTIPGASPRDILFIKQQGGNRFLCSLNPSSGKVTGLYNFKNLPICQPARSRDGRTILLAVPVLKQIFCINGVTGTDAPLGSNIQAFPMKFPLKGESYVNSPSISRDKKLVAVQMRSFTHAGNIAVHDAASGAYDHTYAGILRIGQIASFKLARAVHRQTLYYKDPAMPDMGPERRGWCPVFSPTANTLAYAYGDKIILADSLSGRKMRQFEQPYSLYEKSTLAFSPDGNLLAYIGTVNRSYFGFKDAPGSIVLVDIRNGAGKEILLPQTIRPSSPIEETGAATICLDFSPDGRYVVFSASPRSGDHDSAEETFRDLSGKAAKESDIYVLDLSTGNCRRMTNDNSSFDPLWKGR
ncbi:MAG: hypothetical protein KAW12_27635 [Candidatus Aminicenantes bacterium]|nr:hypothetical protein [Candidatus Aminicenantes bacterium]